MSSFLNEIFENRLSWIFFIKSATKSCDAWTLLEKYSSEYFHSSAGSERRKYVIIRTASPIFIDFIDFLLRQ